MVIQDQFPRLYECFHNKELIQNGPIQYLPNKLTDHVGLTDPELLKEAIDALKQAFDYSQADMLVGEEEKGGFLAACLAYTLHMPFTLAKQNPVHLEGEVGITFPMSYHNNMTLYLNGLKKNDSVIIVEDFVDSGGTLLAMIQTLQQNNITIKGVVTLVDKMIAKELYSVVHQQSIPYASIITIDTSTNISIVQE